ncbi:hypothetical protein [Rhizobium sp. BK602]|uniref:hypothetical protein n=1 Tax=Rhizobium sp. BK602 TaxID=2586986 RepID=UPI00184B5B5B|nr:hypothetical protein [Rhizobium sp. BK602]MBB3608642.1 hypothetical protein [Rhizobium sp. BK602]
MALDDVFRRIAIEIVAITVECCPEHVFRHQVATAERAEDALLSSHQPPFRPDQDVCSAKQALELTHLFAQLLDLVLLYPDQVIHAPSSGS